MTRLESLLRPVSHRNVMERGLSFAVNNLRPGASSFGWRCWRCQTRAITTYDIQETKARLTAKVNDSLGDDGDGNPLRIDADSKTIHTSVGDLPISPIMDPDFMEASQRYKLPKPKPPKSEILGRFRKKLLRNPYAHMLASPLRQCAVTQARLPKPFMQKLSLVPNPKTGDSWLVPEDMTLAPETIEEGSTQEEPIAGVEAPNGGAEAPDAGVEAPNAGEEAPNAGVETPNVGVENPNGSEAENVKAEVGKARSQLEGKDFKSKEVSESIRAVLQPTASAAPEPYDQTPMKSPPSTYVLARKLIFRYIGKSPGSAPFAGYHRSIFGRRQHLARAASGDLVWRADMDDVVLENMRRHVVQALLYLGRLRLKDGRDYLRPCDSWESVKDLKHRGCLLWCGTQPAPRKEGEGEGEEATPESSTSSSPYVPEPFAVFDIPEAKYEKALPVYNLARLLGPKHWAYLQLQSWFRQYPLLMLGKVRSMETQHRLWILEGYMAEYDTDPDEATFPLKREKQNKPQTHEKR